MAVPFTSNLSPSTTGIASTRISTRAPAELRSFAEKLSERVDLYPHALDALRLMHEAFAVRDSDFPKPGCKTLASHAPPPLSAESDDYARMVLGWIQTGAAEERDLECFSWLGLSSLLSSQQSNPRALTEFARQILWLECNSQLALLTYAGSQLQHSDAKELANALAAFIRNADTCEPPLSRGEKWTATCWLLSTQSSLDDSDHSRLSEGIRPPVPLRSVDNHRSSHPGERTLTGRVASAPRGAVVTAVTAFTGWLLLQRVIAWILGLFLGYRANAEVTLSEKGLEIRETRMLLGRRLRERTTLLTMQQIQHLSREVRFARAGTYAGLAALGVGSVLGMRLFVDGLRVPGFSGPLLLLGLMIVLGGLALDFMLANWLDSSKLRCRFLVVAEGGKGLCLANVEPAHADAILKELSHRLRHST